MNFGTKFDFLDISRILIQDDNIIKLEKIYIFALNSLTWTFKVIFLPI